MNMIYLIDDNQEKQRLNRYNISFVEEGMFDDCLVSIEKIKKEKDTGDISAIKFLLEADCVLLHSTTEDVDNENNFIKGSKSNALKIKERISEEGDKIPLVLFSNSMEDTKYENPNYISEIKKDKFYENLYDFLKDYRKTGKIELRILAFGKNFKAKFISDYAENILNKLPLSSPNENLEITEISDSMENLRKFYNMSFPDQDFSKFLIDLEDFSLTVGEFRSKINQITESFEKYGRNIHHW